MPDLPGGPSEAAIDAALVQLERPRCRTVIVDRRNLAQAMECAHDPSLGTDRSVNLGAVLKAVERFKCGFPSEHCPDVRAYLAREFGGTDEK